MYDHYDVYLLLLIWFVVNINDKNLYFIYRYLLLRHFLKEMSENSFSETLIKPLSNTVYQFDYIESTEFHYWKGF